MKPLILSAAIVAALTVSGTAQELCIEPIRPEAAHLLDAGFSGAEIRAEFRRYFSEVEDYLNCLNVDFHAELTRVFHREVTHL